VLDRDRQDLQAQIAAYSAKLEALGRELQAARATIYRLDTDRQQLIAELKRIRSLADYLDCIHG